jgi:hypothetical protein
MTWATHYIEKLKQGETVSFRPRGSSMVPIIKSGQLVTVAPLSHSREPGRGDVVLCHVAGKDYLHKIISAEGIQTAGGGVFLGQRFQIGNNRGYINGWTSREKVYGLVVSVES